MTTCEPTSDPAAGRPRPDRSALAPEARAARSLALFGGSFDPVHRGHLDVAAAARAALGLDHVVFVPAALSPHKTDLPPASGAARVELLERALDHCSAASWASIWTVELTREPPSFTVDTLHQLAALRPSAPRPHLILGEDNLAGLPRWRAVEELLSLARPAVVQRRPGTDLAGQVRALADRLSGPAIDALTAGLVPLDEPSPHSSTHVRAALAAGRDPGEALMPGAWEWIVARGLYPQAGAAE